MWPRRLGWRLKMAPNPQQDGTGEQWRVEKRYALSKQMGVYDPYLVITDGTREYAYGTEDLEALVGVLNTLQKRLKDAEATLKECMGLTVEIGYDSGNEAVVKVVTTYFSSHPRG